MLFAADLDRPAFASARDLIVSAMGEMRFPERVAVSAATNRHRVLRNPGGYSGPWRDSPFEVGFLDRPMDCLGADSPYREVAIMGPSQCGKSEIGNNWQLHTILYDPADMMFVMPDKASISDYVRTQWSKMLDEAPELRARQLDGPSSDNINLKQFVGCDFFFLWPTGPNFRAKPIGRGRQDDYDDIPQDIADQGDPLSLMQGRMASFAAYGRTKIYVNSSPRLGKGKGIEALVAPGTDERYYVDCLQCDEPFLIGHDNFRYETEGTPADAAASAMLVCPDCGGFHVQRDKMALMRSGRWIGKGEEAVSRKIDPEGKTGALLPNSRASFRFEGLMGFRPWSDIAQQLRSADITYELEQDEAPAKAAMQTIVGRNYVAKGSGEPCATEEDLAKRARAATWRLGEFPPEALCLIAAVDQQGNRFEVAFWAFGPGYRAWLVQRFAIVACGDEPLRPFTRPEHFAVLYDKVLSRRFPVAGVPGASVKVFNTVLDTGGLDGATDNAFAWWHSMVAGDVGSGRAPVPATAITLFKGGNKPNGRLLPPPTIDIKRQVKGAPTAELFIPNVNRMKDIADTCLKRSDGGPGAIAFPGDVDAKGALRVADYIAEMRVETKVGELWTRPPHAANETWDLYIMARTALLRFGGNDHSLGWVPPWARPPRIVPAPRAAGSDEAAAALRAARGEEAPSPPPAPLVQGGSRVIQNGGKGRVRVRSAR